MVAIALLIGAEGLGKYVLAGLHYAAIGQDIVAGFAILICEMILDRIFHVRR